MKRIFVPTKDAEDWKRFLAKPDLHWKKGYSARALAHCWEAADGFPPEVAAIFEGSHELELLLAIPEHTVALPGGKQPSYSDLFVLARDGAGQLVVIMVEGKVSERFGPTLGEWSASPSKGKLARLEFLRNILGLPTSIPPSIRYQLLHRTASAVIEARRFTAPSAVMLVHSFNPENLWLDDFQEFARLFGVNPEMGILSPLRVLNEVSLYAGWVKGDPRFLSA